MRVTEKQLREGEPTIYDMRYDLAEREAMNMDTSEVIEMLLEGFEGLENFDDIDIRDEWEKLFGEELFYARWNTAGCDEDLTKYKGKHTHRDSEVLSCEELND